MALSIPTGRNLVILPRTRATRGGIGGASLEPQWPAKDPADTDIYGADWTWVFDGQLPASVVAAVNPAGAVTLVEQSLAGMAYVMLISGGQDGVPATILLTGTSNDGRIEVRAIELPVRAVDAAAEATSPAARQAPPPVTTISTYTQSVPSAVWIIEHDLNRYPNVVVIDAAGDEVEMDVRYVDADTIILTAAGALSGVAYLS